MKQRKLEKESKRNIQVSENEIVHSDSYVLTKIEKEILISTRRERKDSIRMRSTDCKQQYKMMLAVDLVNILLLAFLLSHTHIECFDPV